MAHVMKHTKATCGHMLSHYDRKADHISNENIDKTKTHLNYNLATHQTMSQGDFIRQRCSEVHCQNRKDVNVMCSWVVTAPKDLVAYEHKKFFQQSYDFLCERYGKENVISAYVHMDEVTPHLHFAFVPVAINKKKQAKAEREFKEGRIDVKQLIKEKYKVSAKEVINKTDLKTFHTDLQKHLEKALGHEVHLLNGATADGNQSVEQLKKLHGTQKMLDDTLAQVDYQKRMLTAYENLIKESDAELNKKTQYVNELQEQISKLHTEKAQLNDNINDLKWKQKEENENLENILNAKAKAMKLAPSLFNESVKVDKATYEELRSIGTDVKEILEKSAEHERTAREEKNQRLEIWRETSRKEVETNRLKADIETDRGSLRYEKRRFKEEMDSERKEIERIRKIVEEQKEEYSELIANEKKHIFEKATELFGRMKDFMKTLILGNGKTALDRFEEIEEQRRIDEEIAKEKERQRKLKAEEEQERKEQELKMTKEMDDYTPSFHM